VLRFIVAILLSTVNGCGLSTVLINQWLIDWLDGIQVGGVNINNLRYADDTAMIADDEQKLQELMDVVVEESEKKGLWLWLWLWQKFFCDGVFEEWYHNQLVILKWRVNHWNM